MQSSHTAVVLFAYNRPKHFEATLKSALAELGGRGYKWYVFIDGPKFSSDDKPMLRIAKICERLLHQEEFECKKQPTNIGLKTSIILGVTDVFKRHEQAVILEDDLVVKPGFGDFFSMAFDKYKKEKSVVQISGFSHISKEKNSAYSLPFINSWGWGTWRDRWEEFISLTLNSDLTLHVKRLDNKSFNYNSSYAFSRILKKQIKGQVSSWAILFYLHTFLHNKIAVYPPVTLIENEGFDGSGTHGSFGLRLNASNSQHLDNQELLLPDCQGLLLDEQDRVCVEAALKKMSRKSRLIKLLKNFMYNYYKLLSLRSR